MTTSANWLVEDIAVPVMPPGGVCLPRTPENLRHVVALAQLETARRYQPRDITGDGRAETFCNIFVSDVTRWLGCEIPHDIGGTHTNPDGTVVTIHQWQDVRANAEWLRSGYGSWRTAKPLDAQAHANAGGPAVVVWDSSVRAHGHIALLVPSAAGVRIAQAGRSCFSDEKLVRGFGSLAPLEFFVHD